MDENVYHEEEAPGPEAEQAPLRPRPMSRRKKLLLPTLLSAALSAGAAQYAGCGDTKPPSEAVAEGSTTDDGSNPPEFGPELPVA